MKIFIVDDDKDNVEILSKYFSRLEHEVISALSPKEAMEIIEKMDSYEGVFLVDMNFGGELNGIDFVKWLRENSIFNEVIILTGYADEEKVRICTGELGVKFFISKPVSLHTLSEFLTRASTNNVQGSQFIEQSKNNGTTRILFIERRFEVAKLTLPNRRVPNILCISSQNGCNMGCKFCETGMSTKGTARNLTVEELLQEVYQQNNHYTDNSKQKVCVSIMGMGEPTCNIGNIAEFIDRLDSDKYTFAISTIGIGPQLKEFVKRFKGDPRIELQISIHFPIDKTRWHYMPATKGNLLEPTLDLLEEFSAESLLPGCSNFSLFKEINSSNKCINSMIELMSGRKKIEAKLTRASSFGIFQPVTYDRAEKIKNMFLLADVPCRTLDPLGGSIGVACGQMAAKIGKRR